MRSPARVLAAALAIGMLAPAATPAGAQPAGGDAELSIATEFLTSGRGREAEQELRGILSRQESARVRDLLGVALSQQQRFDEAEREFRRALELDPNLGSAYQNLARLDLERERPREALATLRSAAEIGPLDRDLALHLAAAEAAAGRPEAAERQLESVARRFDSVQALLDLARLEVRRGKQQEARASLRRALELAPNSEEVLSAFARLSLALREPVPAVRALEALTRMHPSVPEHFYLLGVANLQIGENEGAADALGTSLELDPDRSRTLAALGLALNHQKRYGEARAALRRALELEPGNPEALAALAEAEEGLGDLESAERHALAVLERNDSHAGALTVLGTVRMKQQRYEEARDALGRAIATDPTSAKAHYQASLAYARLGDAENSKKHLELYREARQKTEDYLIELRTKAGLGSPGM